jgi:putative ABC transport system ATP-binding protein
MTDVKKVFRTDLIETHALRDFNLHQVLGKPHS